MTLKNITLGFLILTLAGTILGVVVVGINSPILFTVTPIVSLLSFSFTILHAGQREGWKKMPILVALIIAAGLFFESLGVATGLVYGPYHYSDQLGPKFLNLVPYLIPVAWTMMIYPSLVIAKKIIPENKNKLQYGLAVAALTGLVMTAWDVAIDPLNVKAGNWVWEVNGGYFGVPLQNFWGWWLTTFVAIGFYFLITDKMKVQTLELPDRWAVLAYIFTGISSLASCMLAGLSGPALAGFFAMIPWMLLGWMKTSSTTKKQAHHR